jgi:glycyl-tRNA synthetase beta chain
MVGEFPSLQGIMGREYARLAGEEDEVAEAILSHYLPRHAGDKTPENPVGAIVGLADRLDTICGCFGVGLIPSGAADPYALRRQALAIINILSARNLYLDLPGALGFSLALLKDKLTEPAEKTREDVQDFFRTRLQHLLTSEGYSFEVVESVLSTSFTDLVEAAEKVRALEEVRKSSDFPALATAFKRVINISRGASPGQVDPVLFDSPAEHELLGATEKMESIISHALPGRDYPEVCKALAALKSPVDRYFDDVMVMTDDPPKRANRLALLVRISETFLQVADFSKISV